MDIIAIGVANNSGGGGGGTPTDAYSKTETDALLKNKVGFAEYKDNKISLYDSSSKDNVIGEIDLPVDMVVDQIKTKFSQKFKFDSTTYPDTENPNLDGKPVLVLAIKTSATADTFSFLNMESLVDVYTGGTTKSAIISVDSETGVITNVVRISAETGNKIVQKDDGLFVPNQTAADVSYSNTTSKLKATTTQAAIDETLDVANSKYSKPETGIPSTDMTQAVKDSLGKADTALQAADKTELQENINAKLDKTSVLSDFSSSELTNKVPSAQLVLDSFTKKATTEAVTNNTRIITVPENVDCFAGIGMIGGKTQKCKNILKLPKLAERKVNGVTFTPVYDEDDNLLYINANGTTDSGKNATYTILEGSNLQNFSNCVFSISQTQRTTGTLYGAIELSTSPYTSYARAVNNEDVTIKNYDPSSYILIFVRVSDTGTADNIRFYPMIRKANSPAGYEPYREDLWNAPVTAITSVGKNLFDPKAFCDDEKNKEYYTYSNGGIKINAVDGRDYKQFSFSIKVPAGDYSFTGVGSEIRIYDKTSAKQISAEKFTLAVDSEISFKFLGVGNTVYPMLERNSDSSQYVPYSKTTINLSDIFGNLEEVFPDYGASADDGSGNIIYNYIDLEDGYYHHSVKSIKLNGVAFSPSGTNRWKTTNAVDAGLSTEAGIPNRLCFVSNKLAPNNSVISNSGTVNDYDAALFVDKCLYIVLPSTMTTVTQVQEAMKDVVINAKLAEEELIPLSSILPPIHVESNGTLEFVNEHNLDVPTKTIYKKTV